MPVDIHKLIAAINPDLYCDPKVKKEVKALVKEEGYLAAAEVAEPKAVYGPIDFDKMKYKAPIEAAGLKDPIEKHNLSYEAMGEALEKIYFWILDNMSEQYKSGVTKTIDSFVSSPGSGHFAEMGQRATRMQDEAMKILGAVNQVVKSILNITYDLREFKVRLDLYNRLKSSNPNEKDSAVLSLKQIWMDTVDARKGNTAIKAMAQQFDYVTLIDAFMVAKNIEDVKKLDLNDRVKRLVQQRVSEFGFWTKESEKELRKRYEIEKTYLRSQLGTVKLYARWAKPYLRAAKQLEQTAAPTASLVSAFNTTLFELGLIGELEYNPEVDVASGNLPAMFEEPRGRKYSSILITDIKFRSVPERVTQQGGYMFKGKVEANFTGYSLNEEELKVLKEELEKDDFGDVFKAVEGVTEESLLQLQTDLDEFLEEPKEEKKTGGNNPFTALFSFLKPKKKAKEEKKELPKPLKPDNDIEKVLRSQSAIEARRRCLLFYDTYKKAHNMPTF